MAEYTGPDYGALMARAATLAGQLASAIQDIKRAGGDAYLTESPQSGKATLHVEFKNVTPIKTDI